MSALGKAVDRLVSRASADNVVELAGAKLTKEGMLTLKGKSEAVIQVEDDKEVVVALFVSLAMDYARFARKWDMATVQLPVKLSESLRDLFPIGGTKPEAIKSEATVKA